MLLDDSLSLTDDILERARHLNTLKDMAEEILLQAFVLIAR